LEPLVARWATPRSRDGSHRRRRRRPFQLPSFGNLFLGQRSRPDSSRAACAEHKETTMTFISTAPPQADHETLLTADEVSAMLRMSIDSVYLYARTGRLPTIRFDRAVRFRRADVLSFIDRSASKPATLVVRK
jgi:hypothetical protein